jgi:hypothetical protein
MPRTRLLLGGLLGIALLLALGLAVGARSADSPVGLSLLFQNGAMAPVEPVEEDWRPGGDGTFIR